MSQGRYKSWLIEAEDYLNSSCRYVERNALRAGRVERAEDGRWGSLRRWADRRRTLADIPVLNDRPIERPRNA